MVACHLPVKGAVCGEAGGGQEEKVDWKKRVGGCPEGAATAR